MKENKETPLWAVIFIISLCFDQIQEIEMLWFFVKNNIPNNNIFIPMTWHWRWLYLLIHREKHVHKSTTHWPLECHPSQWGIIAQHHGRYIHLKAVRSCPFPSKRKHMFYTPQFINSICPQQNTSQTNSNTRPNTTDDVKQKRSEVLVTLILNYLYYLSYMGFLEPITPDIARGHCQLSCI